MFQALTRLWSDLRPFSKTEQPIKGIGRLIEDGPNPSM